MHGLVYFCFALFLKCLLYILQPSCKILFHFLSKTSGIRSTLELKTNSIWSVVKRCLLTHDCNTWFCLFCVSRMFGSVHQACKTWIKHTDSLMYTYVMWYMTFLCPWDILHEICECHVAYKLSGNSHFGIFIANFASQSVPRGMLLNRCRL